eukprot:COSAG06_NODE_52379_length_306_cov_0.685990_1_plen_39_part_10
MRCGNGRCVRRLLRELIGVRYSTYQWLDGQPGAGTRTNN